MNKTGIVIFSGGSAANSLVDHFNVVASSRNCQLIYAIAISDNGGSSSELIRGPLESFLCRCFETHVRTDRDDI